MRIEQDLKLDFDSVLLRPQRSSLTSRKDVDLFRSFKTPHAGHTLTGVPIIAANMDTVGTFRMADVLMGHGMFTALHKHYRADDLKTFAESWYTEVTYDFLDRVFFSFGMTPEDESRMTQLFDLAPYLNCICLDVANGYTESFLQYTSRVRKRYPSKVIMAGNVVTADMTQALIQAGVDIVKVGIGPGSVCTTRKITGVGYPQLSAIIECADAAHGLGGLVCGDGGCRTSGDIVKAFAGGADFVMLGGMLAGHDECDGEIVYDETPLVTDEDVVTRRTPSRMRFYGMSSTEAMEKHHGGVADHRASEGKCVEVPYRGPVDGTVKEILGGVRSACTYVGARKLKELSKRATFVRCQNTHNTVFGD